MRNPHRRRRGIRRNPFSGGGRGLSLAGIKGIFSRENLMLAGGVASGSLLGAWVVQQPFYAKLPGVFKADGTANPTVNLAYGAAIPVLAGLAINKFSPKLGTGMVMGGLATAILGAVNLIRSQAQLTTSTGASTTGEYFDGPGYRLGYDRARRLTGLVGASPYDPQTLVTRSAW
jgi:hypothetical protein